MSELPPGVAPGREPVPAESALAIVLERGRSGEVRVLLGLRARRSRFMPGHLAFPGGRLEPADRPREPGDGARCASRELREETGVVVPAERLVDAGERITPPMFPVRFRTRIFLTELTELRLPPAPPAPDEIEALEVARPADVLAAWARGETKLPPPVLPMLRVLAEMTGRGLGEIATALVAANAQEERAPRIEFSPDIWVVPLRTATLPPATHTNVWMPGGRSFAIVDPGATESDELRRLYEVVERRRALGHAARAVLLTHHHSDHAGGALEVARTLGVPLRAHAKTLEALGHRGPDVSPLADGEEIDLDGLVLRALHTPGHAPGHLAFLVLGRGELIAGDLASSLSTILIDPSGGEMGAYLDSLARVAALDCHTLLPGHGAPLPARAIPELIAHRREREAKVLAATAAHGPALAAIARAAYDDLPDVPQALIERQTLAHLFELERSGKVGRSEGAGHDRWFESETAEEERR
jgi:glyoxylase-like metal-dependent hydrolase (beta-lactamase superfamily II)/8-oxo-dGTP pyrophosphatase MutT (NUDIX family)